MPRILGVDIPKEKRIEAALPYIYGVGPYRTKLILKQLGINPDRRAKDLTDDEIAKITTLIQTNCVVEGDLRREISQNIKGQIEIASYRGLRHRKGLPVRGQRTRTNSRTRKGKKVQAAMKKEPVAGKK